MPINRDMANLVANYLYQNAYFMVIRTSDFNQYNSVIHNKIFNDFFSYFQVRLFANFNNIRNKTITQIEIYNSNWEFLFRAYFNRTIGYDNITAVLRAVFNCHAY